MLLSLHSPDWPQAKSGAHNHNLVTFVIMGPGLAAARRPGKWWR
jgi:hypothetical protein